MRYAGEEKDVVSVLVLRLEAREMKGKRRETALQKIQGHGCLRLESGLGQNM